MFLPKIGMLFYVAYKQFHRVGFNQRVFCFFSIFLTNTALVFIQKKYFLVHPRKKFPYTFDFHCFLLFYDSIIILHNL